MSEPNSIMINDVKYVPEGTVPTAGLGELVGLRYAIVRSKDQGVMAGFVKEREGRRVVLLRARQIWRFSCPFVLTDLAEKGTTALWENKYSCESSQETEMLEACGIHYCTNEAMRAIRAVKAQEPGCE